MTEILPWHQQLIRNKNHAYRSYSQHNKCAQFACVLVLRPLSFPYGGDKTWDLSFKFKVEQADFLQIGCHSYDLTSWMKIAVIRDP